MKSKNIIRIENIESVLGYKINYGTWDKDTTEYNDKYPIVFNNETGFIAINTDIVEEDDLETLQKILFAFIILDKHLKDVKFKED